MLKVYDSKIRREVEFQPVRPGEVSFYVCGPTVQSSPHIGHIRVAVAFDVIRRYFAALGLKTRFVQNVTDIDDKILRKSHHAGVDWQSWAARHEQEFFDAYTRLNVLLPDVIPHATQYISEQVKMIKKILAAGYAYEGTGADVWFDTLAFTDYGALTNQGVGENLEASEEDYRADKRNPRDFALWKTPHTTDPEDAAWDSPWGRGRPGWHIECSAMATEILGAKFDIHGGGLDLRFPHHENELAQARACGYEFANIWMHSAWVTAKGEKMSKSLGNGLSVSEVLAESRLNALALRYAFSTVHYRSMLEWTPTTLESSKTAIIRLRERLCEIGGEKYTDDIVGAVDITEFDEFVKSMDNDFAVADAVAKVFTAVKRGDVSVLLIRRALNILGIDPLCDTWRKAFEEEDAVNQNITTLELDEESINSLIDKRNVAKSEKNYSVADEIRADLLSRGVELIDTANGTEWKVV